jgi:hypothetical protein
VAALLANPHLSRGRAILRTFVRLRTAPSLAAPTGPCIGHNTYAMAAAVARLAPAWDCVAQPLPAGGGRWTHSHSSPW